jgi:aldehyde:ferredoxin oxidoreductase
MKGQDSADPYRIRKGWGFGLATSPVAGRHLRGAVSTPDVSGPRSLAFSPTEYKNIPEAVFWQVQAKEIEDMTGICVYLGSLLGAHALEPSDYAELTSSALGIDLTEEEFMLIGKRSYNLEKAFNTIHTSFERKDDYPPKRYMEEPVKSGPYTGHKLEKDKFDGMLDRFYELNGWDKETSLQTYKGLIELGMEDVAQKLEEAGRLK